LVGYDEEKFEKKQNSILTALTRGKRRGQWYRKKLYAYKNKKKTTKKKQSEGK